MTPSAHHADATLGEWLTAHARAVSPRRLALDVVGGGLVACLVALWRPAAWPALLGASLCFVAFGVWATAERRLVAARAVSPSPADIRLPRPGEPAPRDWAPAWRALRAVAGVLGVIAAALAGFGFLFGVLGTWIS